MHTLIVGITESGKTTEAKKLANIHVKTMPVIVLTSVFEFWGPGIEVYDDQDEFLARYWDPKGMKGVAFIDEGKRNAGRFNEAMEFTATEGRHYGWSNYYIGQEATMISPEIRGQCTQCLCFVQSEDDAEVITRAYRVKELKQAITNLKKGEFFVIRKFGEDGGKYVRKCNAFKD